jgi:hypothetical protein
LAPVFNDRWDTVTGGHRIRIGQHDPNQMTGFLCAPIRSLVAGAPSIEQAAVFGLHRSINDRHVDEKGDARFHGAAALAAARVRRSGLFDR